MSALLKELMVDFGFITEQDGLEDVDKQVKAQLDRSAKMDEVDTVTFGLDTDDGRTVRVYVRAEQANDFEKALAEKLGSVDSIEQAINELSKDFDIIAVDWPPEKDADDQTDDDEDEETPAGQEPTPGEGEGTEGKPEGEEAPDQQVYFNRNGAQGETMSKESTYKEQVLGRLLSEKQVEVASPAYGFKRGEIGGLDPYLNHPVQRMIYKAILELGVPDVALTKSAYRSPVIQGIKRHAAAVMRDSTLRLRLGYFLNQEIKQGEESGGKTKKESQDIDNAIMLAEQDATAEFDGLLDDLFKMMDSSPDNKYAKTLKATSAYRAMMRGATGTSSAAYASLKSRMKMFRDQLTKTLGMRDQETRKANAIKVNTPKTAVGGVAESTLIEADWQFSQDADRLVMMCDALTISLDEENAERLIKGMSNREAVVVKDAESGSKYSFSPRGSAVQVRATGSKTVCEMPSKDVDRLLDTIAKSEMTSEELEELGLEPINEVSPPGWEGTVKAMKKHSEISNPWALAWHMKKKGYKSRKKVEEELLDEKRRHHKRKKHVEAPPVDDVADTDVDADADQAPTDDAADASDDMAGGNGKNGNGKRKKKRADDENAVVNGGSKKNKSVEDDMPSDTDEVEEDDAGDDENGGKKKKRKYKSFLDAQGSGMEPGLKDAPHQVGGAKKK